MRPDIVSTLVLAVAAVALPIVADVNDSGLFWRRLRNGVHQDQE